MKIRGNGLAIIGLSFLMASCRIGGDSVRVVNSSNSSSETTTAIAPTNFSYLYSTWIVSSNNATVDNIPTISGQVRGYSIDDLPTGMSINSSTGIISGTPTVAQGATTYTVTATSNTGGSVTTTVNIRVIDGYYVDSTDFATADDNPGDGICSMGGTQTGPCSLRAAFEENAASGPRDVVVAPGRYVFNAQYTFAGNWGIYGNSRDSVIFDGDKATGLFATSAGGLTLTIQGFTAQNCDRAGAGGFGEFTGAGTSVTLSDFTVRDCNATSAGGALYLFTGVTATISDCLFEGNESTGNRGGAIYDSSGSTNTISRCIFRQNNASSGGGAIVVTNAGADMTVEDSHFEYNTTDGSGGAFENVAGDITIQRTSFFRNRALTAGGAITITSGASTNIIRNSTFGGNVTPGSGGAIAGTLGTIAVTNSTIVDNECQTANCGPAIYGGATYTITENILAGNRDQDGVENCRFTGGSQTFSYNIVDTAHADCGTAGGTNDVASTDPLISGLGFYGGYPMTARLRSTSPAINGTGGACNSGTAEDARGTTRDGDCDIGSYEYSTGDPPTHVSYGREWVALQNGKAIGISLVPATQGGTPSEFSISPNLPSGLSLDTSTGEISGTPTATTPDDGMYYKIKASNAGGEVATYLRLSVLDGYEVDSTGDASDASAGDGTCATAGAVCTLRAAIDEAEATAGRQIITFDSGISAITLGSTLPTVDKDLVIAGRGTDSTTITYTSGSTLDVDADGGTDDTHISLSDITFSAGASAYVLELFNSQIRIHNIKIENKTGSGSAIHTNAVRAEISGSFFYNNDHTATSRGGGAISLSNAYFVNIYGNTFVENQVTNGSAVGGGAMYILNNGAGWIHNNIFYNNASVVEGGALGINEVGGSLYLIIEQNAFSSNSATHGGAFVSADTGDHFSLNKNLFFNNTASNGAGGGAIEIDGEARLFGNLFEGNTNGGGADACAASGTILVQGYNITDTAYADCGTSAGTNDIESDSAEIAETVVSQVPVYTLSATAPGIDQLGSAHCATSTYDIHGAQRVDSTNHICDIGPIEY